jgi:hypothetical protein
LTLRGAEASRVPKETMMDARNSGNRIAMGITAVVVVLGTLAGVWQPGDTSGTIVASDPPVVAPAPDMSVYFPDRFAAPKGPVEPLPPQF